jgi:hypothetical protein
MVRGPCTFRQRDVTAAVKAVVDAGVSIARVEVDKEGKVSIVLGKADSAPADDLDAELADFEARHNGQDRT